MRLFFKIYKAMFFAVFYFLKLFQANIYIAYDILTPKTFSDPGLIWVPIRLKSKLGLLLYSNLVSMTPGTLSIDYAEEKQALLVHTLYNSNKIIEELESIQNKIIDIIEHHDV